MTDDGKKSESEEKAPPQVLQSTIIGKKIEIDSIAAIYGRFIQRSTPFGFHVSDERAIEFHPLPYKPESSEENPSSLLLKQPWRVVLEMLQGEKRLVLGLDLYGDVILGRGESRPGLIVVDMEPYDAVKLGVSRVHAMLRPTKSHLYLIDQGSTNGTTVNGASVQNGLLNSLKDEDVIALGDLILMVKTIAKPE
jgi:hypothetical protein